MNVITGQYLRKFAWGGGGQLVSFDVKSLFTNDPVPKALETK